MKKKYTAFTLAEVLIVIGIIGMIADMTIPTLLNKSEEAQLAAALTEDVSLFSQVTMQMATDNGGEIPYQDNTYVFLDKMATKLKTIKRCTSPLTECWTSSLRISPDTGSGDPITCGTDSYVLANGTSMCFLITGSGDGFGGALENNLWDYEKVIPKKVYGNAFFMFDVNGPKPPNKAGLDIHCPVIFLNGGVSVMYRPPDTGSGDSLATLCDENSKNNLRQIGNFGCSKVLFEQGHF